MKFPGFLIMHVHYRVRTLSLVCEFGFGAHLMSAVISQVCPCCIQWVCWVSFNGWSVYPPKWYALRFSLVIENIKCPFGLADKRAEKIPQ